MKFAEKLLKHPEFLQLQKRVQEMEQDRIYCHHELSHALDVCRMAWMMYLEDEYKTHLKEYRAEIAGQYITDLQTDDADHTEKPYLNADNMLAKKDQFYVTGLLHDIGRVAQYETGEHHSVAGVRIAEKLLTEIEYPSEWMRETLQMTSFLGWNTIFAGRIIFQETVFYVKHQIPVNGRKKNVIRRFAGKSVVKNGTVLT